MIPDIVPVNTWAGNSSNTEFDFDFLINKESELQVLHTDKNGVQTELRLNIDYTIYQIGNEKGSYITFPILGSSYSVLAEGEKITLALNIPIAQTVPFGTSTKLNLNSIEYVFDYVVRLIQILARKIERSIKVQEGSESTPDDLINSLNQAQINAQNFAQIASDKAAAANASAIAAGEEATIATQKTAEIQEIYTQAMSDISQTLESATGEIQTLANSTLSNIQSTGIDTRATVDLNNLSDKGELLFLKTAYMGDGIVSCSKRIKYEQSGNTLTIKAGSVVIVPYGTEDLSQTTCAVGNRFINENYKIYDVKWNGSQLVLWIELLKDISLQATSPDMNAVERFISVNLTSEGLDWVMTSGSGSGYTTAPTVATIYYNTATCSVEKYTKNVLTPSTDIISLPIGKIQQIGYEVIGGPFIPFLAIGYIGTRVFYDADIKYLTADGISEDGTVQHNENVTKVFLFEELNTQGASKTALFLDDKGYPYHTRVLGAGRTFPTTTPDEYSWAWYSTSNKKWYTTFTRSTTPDWASKSYCYCGYTQLNATKTELCSFVPSFGYMEFTTHSCSPFWFGAELANSTIYNSKEQPAVISGSYFNGESGWVYYSNGLLAQWGKSGNLTADRDTTVNLLYPYSNNKYFVTARKFGNWGNEDDINLKSKSTNSFVITATQSGDGGYTSLPAIWYAIGFDNGADR